MEETIKIQILGEDRLTSPAQRARQSLHGLEGSVNSTSRALGGLTGFLSQAASAALGFGAAMAVGSVLNAVTSGIANMASSMISLNAEAESARISFEVLLSDAAAASGGVVAAEEEVGQAAGSSARAVQNAQERMADSAEDHRLAVAKLAQEFAKLENEGAKALGDLSGDYQRSLAEMGRSHAGTMTGLQKQLEDYSRAFARQSDQRRRRFDEEMASISRKHADEAKSAPDRFLREREAAKQNQTYLEKAIADEEAKGSAADQTLLASLKSRLTAEQAAQARTYAEFLALQRTAQAAEIAQAKSRFAEEEALAAESNQRQLAAVRDRMAAEEQEFAEATARRATQYAADVEKYRESEAEKRAALQERQADEARGYARTARDAAEAMAAAGAAQTKALAKTRQATGQAVNEMAEMYADLATFAGKPLDTAKDRADAMFDWISKKAKETPFEMPQVRQTVQTLTAYQLNALKFFDTVGNVAAGMNKPLDQVANAFGRLATGQVGEAAEAFRTLGINIRNIEGLKFDAQGALVTPTEEALTKVKAAMDERFKNMMERQSKGFVGVTSNLRDAWTRFQLVMGEPIFQQLEGALGKLLTYVDENEGKLKQLATTIGVGLAGVLTDLGPKAEKLMVGFFEWVKSGQAQKDVDAAVLKVREFVKGLVDTYDQAKDTAKTIGDLADKFGKVAGAVGDVIGWFKDHAELTAAIVGFAFALKAAAVAQGLLNFAMAANPVGLVIAAIAGLAAGLIYAYENSETFRNIVDGVFAFLKENVTIAIAAIGTTIDNLVKWTTIAGGNISNTWDAVAEAVRTAINSIIGFLNSLIKAWNMLEFKIPGFDITLPGGAKLEWGGFKIETPDLPEIPAIPAPKKEPNAPVRQMDWGGIVTRPTLAALAMNNRPEAVLPLADLEQMLADRKNGKPPVFYLQITGGDLVQLIRGELVKIQQANGSIGGL